MKRQSIAALTFVLACASSYTVSASQTSNISDKDGYHHNFSQSCETNINAKMKFKNNQLTVFTEEDQHILFDASGRVLVDGEIITLSDSEQTLAKRYYQEVEQAIPMVTTIAVEAINITNMALTEVFTGLLGENSKLPLLIDDKLSKISEAIEHHVYQSPDSLTFDSEYFEDDLGFDNSLESEIEEITEELMSTAMGEMLMALGKAMISGEGDSGSFEQRMERLGEEIEAKADALSLKLEEKAESLCEQLQQIDETENKLQSVAALRELNMINFVSKKA